MTHPRDTAAEPGRSAWMLPIICTTAFLVFVQAFMIAPLIPRLAEVFGADVGLVGLAVPAYLLPYGIATLGWGPLSDRLGRRTVILGSLVLFVVCTAATALTRSITGFIGWRVVTGVVASGTVPIGLTLIGDVVPFANRGRAIGWLFGSIAGGTAVGAAVGAIMEPLVGWQGLFLVVAGVSAVIALVAIGIGAIPVLPRRDSLSFSVIARGYAGLVSFPRGRRTYAYVLINAVLQSGVYTWLGLYLQQRFGLGEVRIGLALLGYGIPGLLFGPAIGRLADRHGRSWIIPAGVALTAVCALALAAPLTLVFVQVAIILLSLGYDLTQPLLAGIVTDLPGNRAQATGLMAFTLFTGFGLGSLLFQIVMVWGFSSALIGFGCVGLLASSMAVPFFRMERPPSILPA